MIEAFIDQLNLGDRRRALGQLIHALGSQYQLIDNTLQTIAPGIETIVSNSTGEMDYLLLKLRPLKDELKRLHADLERLITAQKACPRPGTMLVTGEEDDDERIEQEWVVDIPNPDQKGFFMNVATLETYDQALKFAQDQYGADAEGRIGLISKIQ